MHIPDNFLSPPVWAALDCIAVPAVAWVSRKAEQCTDSSRLPLLGVLGAFVFAAQMINFPVGVGASGHLVGGTLLACLLGPWPAALALTAILILQALVFQDGGVLALGANVVNMALLGVLAGYLPARWLSRSAAWSRTGVFLGGGASVLTSGILALCELRLSGIRMSAGLLAASVALFAVNAIAEGAITVSVLGAIRRWNPEFGAIPKRSARIHRAPRPARLRKTAAIVGGTSLLLAAFGVFVASTLPDALQTLASRLGAPVGANPFLHAPLGDYRLHVLGSNWLDRSGAGLLGLLMIYVACVLGGRFVGRVRRSYARAS